jgi:hypothetical protein
MAVSVPIPTSGLRGCLNHFDCAIYRARFLRAGLRADVCPEIYVDCTEPGVRRAQALSGSQQDATCLLEHYELRPPDRLCSAWLRVYRAHDRLLDRPGGIQRGPSFSTRASIDRSGWWGGLGRPIPC